jgi:hypothetical protein
MVLIVCYWHSGISLLMLIAHFSEQGLFDVTIDWNYEHLVHIYMLLVLKNCVKLGL